MALRKAAGVEILRRWDTQDISDELYTESQGRGIKNNRCCGSLSLRGWWRMPFVEVGGLGKRTGGFI